MTQSGHRRDWNPALQRYLPHRVLSFGWQHRGSAASHWQAEPRLRL